MGFVCCRDQVLGIEDVEVAVVNIFRRDGVHVVDDDPVINLKAFDTQVATKVSSDYLVSDSLPLRRAIECLIEVALIAECSSTNAPTNLQIFKPLFKSIQSA